MSTTRVSLWMLLAATTTASCAVRQADTRAGSPAYNQPQSGVATSATRADAFAAPPPATAPQPTAAPSYPFPSSGVPSLPGELPKTDPAITIALAEQWLTASMSSCDMACKALLSMEHAVQQICSSDTDPNAPRCTDAKARLRRSRAKVREACSVCPEGPATDPDAPI